MQNKENTKNTDYKDETASLNNTEAQEGVPAEKNESEKPKKRLNWHLLILAVIVLFAGITTYKLMKWNKGTPSDYDPNAVTTDFDVEVLDMIIPMDASKLEGREDDGVTTILCLGNNPFSDELGKKGLAAQIAEKTGAVVYNGGFPESAVACKYPSYNREYTRDHFNLYYVTQAIINQEFTALSSVAGDEEDPTFTTAVETLSSVDMDKVDVIVMMYDTTDYNILSPSDNPDSIYDVTAYTGALRTSIQNLQAAFPYIRIFLMSHSYARYPDEDGNLLSGNITDLGNGDLPHYLVMELNAAMDCGVSFIDNYFGTINEDNYKKYMSDYMHYNDAGRELLAQRIADIIKKSTGVVSSAVAE